MSEITRFYDTARATAPAVLRHPTGELRRSWATIDGPYRYDLGRRWDHHLPIALWVMLNPSTADALDDDPTIRRVRSFTEREGCGGFAVVNLCAWRATDPQELLGAPGPVGPNNHDHVAMWIHHATGPVIAAWGAGAARLQHAGFQVPPVEVYAEALAKPLWCLGVTGGGHPRHPLYVKGDTPLVELHEARHG